MRVAIYARVSMERQERQQTIDSQLDALRSWVVSHEHILDDGHVFRGAVAWIRPVAQRAGPT